MTYNIITRIVQCFSLINVEKSSRNIANNISFYIVNIDIEKSIGIVPSGHQ